ncbi:hypothetical protein GDO81_024237, partial [Engystomops pustulosus]
CKEARFVPGHTLLGEGIDIVTMKTTGSFLFDLQEVEKRCTVCENPHNQNVLQKLPKALVDWRPESTCSRNIQGSVSQSKVSVANDVTTTVENDWKVGLNVTAYVSDGIVAVGGSHSKMAKFADSKSLTDTYNFLSHKLECSFYSFGLGSNASFTPHYEKALSELPDSYNTMTKATYRHLISNFGTHYITRVRAGGLSKYLTAVRTCQLEMNGLKVDEVKDCLSVEAKVELSDITKSASINSKYEHCKNKLRKTQFGGDFHTEFNEYVSEMESLKTHPGLVSYSLDSIHTLVRIRGPKRENLRLAISDYVNERALIQRCTCPGGRTLKLGSDCLCSCPASRYTSSNCCPTSRGAAKLHVTILYGTGLKGDWFSETDAYVIFGFDSSSITTPTIPDNDNPKWEQKFNMGEVELSAGKKYTIQVWDEDKGGDDFLGKCEKVLSSGKTPETCYLNRGSVAYSMSVTCADHLQGMFCQDYVPVPPSV